jgi:hypothetical protein
MIMRKITYFLSTIILFVFTNEINAQLFVKDNSYVYNKGTVVYVSDYVNLEGDIDVNGTSGNFYLRQEGQLLQSAATVASTNTGSGKLSVFQEGTVNNYAFNYWCSPIGNGSLTNDFGITLLGVPTNIILPATPAPTIGYNPISFTTSSYNGFATNGAVTISSYWIFKYSIPSANYATGWQPVGPATTISAGQGFTMKGVSGDDSTDVGESAVNNPALIDSQRYDFRGEPNDGTIAITVAPDLFTLTGNPYPSAIDLSAFLTDPLNNRLDGKAYFWQQDKTINSHNLADYRGGYAVYNGFSGIHTPAPLLSYMLDGTPIVGPIPPESTSYLRRFSPVGQGFMVRGESPLPAVPSPIVAMRNDYRVFRKEGAGVVGSGNVNLTQFERNAQASTSIDYGFYDDIINVAGIDYTQISKAPTPQIKINSTLNGNAIRQVIIGFMNSATDGIEKADTKSPNTGEAALPMDVYFVINNTEFINNVTTFDINKRFPIGFKNNGQVTASFKLQVYEFVNFEAAENVYLYDGLTGLYHNIKNNYYDVVLAPGVYNNRFEITFLNNVLEIENNIADNFIIVQNNPNQLLTIANPNLLDVKSVVLYDITGKLIFNKLSLGAQSNYEFSTVTLSEAVYVVKLNTVDDKSVTQKIIIKKIN